MYIITLGRKDSFRGAFEVENSLLWTSRAELLSVCYVVSLWGSRGILRLGRGVACELIQNQSSLPSGQCHPISCHLRAACSVSYKGAQFIFQTEISKYLKFAAYSNTCSSDKSGLSLELGLDMYLTELQ